MGGSRKALIALVLAIGFGVALGIAVGLVIGWVIWPVSVKSVDVVDLTRTAQDDYIVMTASAYAYDQDLYKAQARLDLLDDKNIERRMGVLAKILASKNPKEAGYVASLALALGAEDDALAQMVATVTPVASPTAAATITRVPTITPTTPPGSSISSLATVTRTPTRPRPTATSAPKPTTAPPAPAPGTQWIPGFPGEWPPGTNFQPANVAPGQKYWHLVKALYCDDRDPRNDCPNLPGGDTGTSTYVSILSEGGARTGAPLIVTKGDGNVAGVDDIGPEKSPDDMCRCNYSFLSNGWQIKVGGAASDAISGLALYSVRMRLPQAHTRYYLTYQLVTR